MRKDRRAPASLKVKYKSASVDEFIEQFGADVSRGGIFIKTKKPLDTGALLKFEFQLQTGAPVIHGVGRVAWRRGEAHARADLPAGMGIKFIKLDEASRAVIERIESRHGPGSRFDQTEAAELAPPLSSVPPTAASDRSGLTVPPAAKSSAPPVRPTPVVPAPPLTRANGPKLPLPPVPPAVHAAPTFRPPPPAMSSIPPALGDGWASRSGSPASRAGAPGSSGTPASRAGGSGARPAPTSGVPKGALGGTSSRKPVPAPRSTARDTSEFLASAFSVGGAGAEVRNQAQAQVERARRDPQSVDLANELFGDLSEPSQKSDLPEVDLNADLEPLRSRSSDPKPPSPAERQLAEKIPSIEELISEPAPPPPESRRETSGRAEAAGFAGAVATSTKPANDAQPLSLELAPLAAGDAGGAAAASRGRGAWPLVVAAVLALAVAAGVIFVLRPRVAPEPPPSVPAKPEPPAAPPSAAAPTAPPAAAPEKPAEPAAAPVHVTFEVNSEPRGAEVAVDGKSVGATPVTLSLMSQATVELKVRSAGFATKIEKVTPAPGMAPLQIALAPLPYVLSITTDPPGAIVKVGEQKVESPAPLDLGHIDGPVTASIEREGFQRMSRSVRLDEFRERDGTLRAELSVSLSPLPGARRRIPAAAARPVARTPEGPPEPGAPPPEPGAAEPPEPPVMQVKPAGADETPPAAKEAAPAEPLKPAPSDPAAPPAPASP